jgi:hypothetical protein
LISENELRWQSSSSNVRKFVLRVFPFNVYYVDAPSEVIIVAVAAHRRRPGYWRRRLT